MVRQATVFVGNIPYDTTEEQLKEVFSQAGSVGSFRLVYDPNTGKPKGYGFCEYDDPETAMSALRNLNNVEVNGRALRVDLAEHDKSRVQEHTGLTIPSTKPPPPQTAPQPPGVDLGAAGGRTNMRIERMTPEEIYDVMVRMKEVVERNPEEVQKLLMRDPNLTYALLQGQVMLGMVPSQAISTASPVPPPAKVGTFEAPARPPTGTVPPVGVQQSFPVLPPQGPTPPLPTPPIGASTDQTALLQQLSQNQGDQLQMVMQLTPAQVEQLPPADRQVVMQLQRTVRMVGSSHPPPPPQNPMY